MANMQQDKAKSDTMCARRPEPKRERIPPTKYAKQRVPTGTSANQRKVTWST